MIFYSKKIAALMFFSSLFLSACGGSSNEENKTQGSTPTPTPNAETFSVELDPTVSNEKSAGQHSNNLSIKTEIEGVSLIGYVSVIVLDDLDIFTDEIDVQPYAGGKNLAIQLKPKKDLRRGNYEGQIALSFCDNSDCEKVYGEPYYVIDYLINYIPESWSFDIQAHEQLISSDFKGYGVSTLRAEFASTVGDEFSYVEVLVDWPEGYTGFTLPKEMIDDMQVFDIREDRFSFQLDNSVIGSYLYEYEVTLNADANLSELETSGRNPSETTVVIGHAVVPSEFDGFKAHVFSEQLDFAIENRFHDTAPAQVVRVYLPFKPFGSSFFERLEFEDSACRWLDIDDGIGINEGGFTDVSFEVVSFYLKEGLNSCEVDVEYLDQRIATMTVNAVSGN